MEIHARRLLLHTPLYNYKPTTASSPASTPAITRFDSNVITVLAIVLCAMIGALAVNAFLRLLLRCMNPAWCDPQPQTEPEPGCGDAAWHAQAELKKKKAAAVKALPSVLYSAALDLRDARPECAICLAEFSPGDHLRMLPECSHWFHVACVDRWLVSRSSCPTCRRCLFTGGKGGDLVRAAAQPVVVTMDPEGVLISYRPAAQPSTAPPADTEAS